MNTFYFQYKGNKRNEIIYIKDLLENLEYEIFVEPFGGTCALSRYINENYKDKDIYINDINKDLCYFSNNFYNHQDEVILNIKTVIESIKDEQDYKNYYKKAIKRNIENCSDVDYLTFILFEKSCFRINPGHFYREQVPKFIVLSKVKQKLNDFFIKHYYYNHDYKETFEKFKNNEKALLFLDPPYVNSDVCDYDNNNKNQYSNMWEDIYDLFENSKCKIIMIVNNNFFMRKVFNKWFYNSYEKAYRAHRSRKTIHNIFLKK